MLGELRPPFGSCKGTSVLNFINYVLDLDLMGYEVLVDPGCEGLLLSCHPVIS